MFFDAIQQESPDPLFGIQKAFSEDEREAKVDLSVGIYKTLTLITPTLSSVKSAEKELLKEDRTKEYLPIEGDRAFIEQCGDLLFGRSLWSREKERIAGLQAIGGTSALRLGAEFLRQELSDHIFVSNPTWPNHHNVFERCGMNVKHYPYYDKENKCLAYQQMFSYLESLPPGSIIVMHAVCHNPTGIDPTEEQWKELSDLFLKKKLIPFFDCAYHGFGSTLFEDAKAMRLFVEKGNDMLIAYSFSKNMGLYNERIGALYIITQCVKSASHVMSKLRAVIRGNYSNPSWHGAAIVEKVLSSEKLRKEWETELSKMRKRIEEMREFFIMKLSSHTKIDFSFLKGHSGMFSYTGLEKEQVLRLKDEYAIYLPHDGRINIAGLNHQNVDYVTDALLAVWK